MTVKSTITPEPAGIWLRVSTADQTEASQEPDILAWCQAHGYTVARQYTLNGKSAYHGKQQDAIDEALADLRGHNPRPGLLERGSPGAPGHRGDAESVPAGPRGGRQD